MNLSLYKTMPYDAAKDFAPITLIAITPNVLVVNASLPVNSAKEFIAYAKGQSGKLSFGSGSNGSAGHLAGEALQGRDQHRRGPRPFKGAPATQALLAGDTQFMFDNLANAMAQVKAGKIKALAVTTAQRSSLVPELPTMAERDCPASTSRRGTGSSRPPGTPPAIVAKWNADVTKILNLARRARKADGGRRGSFAGHAEQFREFIARELAKYARIVKASGAKVD